jgi:hypothetical protein
LTRPTEAKIGDLLLEGIVQTKQEAINKYDDAIASGHGAFLLEQDSEGIFKGDLI